MRLIFIYGPPAVGKLTIGEKLSEITGIPLFHNHLTRDIVHEIYGDKTAENYKLVSTLRKDVLTYCAQNDTDIISTFVYDGRSDDEIVREYIRCIEDNGGSVYFVELQADREDLLQRVSAESRMRYKKLQDAAVLNKLLDSMQPSIKFVDALVINTSQITPDEAAERIRASLKML